MSLAAKAIDKLVNPPRVSQPDRPRDAVCVATVLVTGSSFGIGEATVCKLAAAGATVLLAARSGDKLDGLSQVMSASGGHAVSYPANLSDEETATRLAKRIADEHGPPDIVSRPPDFLCAKHCRSGCARGPRSSWAVPRVALPVRPRSS